MGTAGRTWSGENLGTSCTLLKERSLPHFKLKCVVGNLMLNCVIDKRQLMPAERSDKHEGREPGPLLYRATVPWIKSSVVALGTL